MLQAAGLLLLAFHIGDEVVHFDEMWGCPICMDFFYFQPAEVRNYMEAAGLVIEEVSEREPYAPEGAPKPEGIHLGEETMMSRAEGPFPQSQLKIRLRSVHKQEPSRRPVPGSLGVTAHSSNRSPDREIQS